MYDTSMAGSLTPARPREEGVGSSEAEAKATAATAGFVEGMVEGAGATAAESAGKRDDDVVGLDFNNDLAEMGRWAASAGERGAVDMKVVGCALGSAHDRLEMMNLEKSSLSL